MGILDKILKKKTDDTKVVPVLPKDIYQSGVLELQDVIAPSALKITPRELSLGEKVVRSFFVISYPRFLTDSWFSPIVNMEKVFDVSIFIHPIDTTTVLRHFQKKVAEVQSQIHLREEKGLVRDPILDTAYQDLEQLRDDLQQAQERLFDVGLYISIYGESEQELDKAESEIKSMLESKLVYVKPALFQQEEGFKSIIPLGTDLLAVHSKLNTSPLSSIFPFVSFDLTSDKGILYGVNRHNSSLILFDRFSLENYNSIMFAKSGSGKSIRKDEPVLIRRNDKVELLSIGKVVDETIQEQGVTFTDEELEGTRDPGIEVFSFNADLKGRWSKVTVAARKDAPDTYYRFTTKSGREITTTGDHNMLVLREGKVEVVRSTAVAVGESVPLPRQIAYGGTTKVLNLLDILREKNAYVRGAADVIRSKLKKGAVTKKCIDPKLDQYLYKYLSGRRIPIRYFNKLIASLHIDATEIAHTLSITSASGKHALPALLPVSEALGTLLGYLAAEGTITRQAAIISNLDPVVIQTCATAFKSLGLPYFTTSRSIVSTAKPFIWLLEAIGATGYSKAKHVPGVLFDAPQSVRAAYLTAYFEGDGCVEAGAITALSKSKRLISELSYVLLSFGIIARIGRQEKRYAATGRKRAFWHLSISGQDGLRTFATHINFASARKRQRLEKVIEKTGNTNVDTVPTLASIFLEIRALLPSQLHNLPTLSAVSRNTFNPSPGELRKLVEEIERRLRSFETLRSTITSLSLLPQLEEMIQLGERNRELNRLLWQKLGSSWAWIKSRKGAPGIGNVRILFETVLNAQSVRTLHTDLHQSFKTLDANLEAYNPSFGVSLRKGLPPRTSYATLQNAAEFISNAYETAATNLPRVHELLATLRRLAEADLFWDPIVSVEEIANLKERYVYDLTVEDGVFLAGTAGMFVHNSYFAKLEILRTLMFDTDVIVIDPEREYEYLSQVTGGRYFNISLTSDHHINPFDLPIPREDESPNDVLRSHIVSLVGLFRIMLGGLTPEEDSIIDRAITETYALKDITPDSNFADAEPPLLSDFELVLAGMEGADSLVQRLAKYTKGTWSGFINRPTNVDINKKFVVFSVRDMENELRPVAMYIVTNFVWNAVRKTLKKRLLVVDEAHWMMKSEDTASFLYNLAKRGRKYYLGLATITQDVNDFLQSEYGLPIITNSSIQVLLKQSPTTIDLVQKTFNLTDEEKYLLLESDVGEGIFFAGLKHVAIKVIASYTEDQIITSKPSQLLALKKARVQETADTKEKARVDAQNLSRAIAEPATPPMQAPVEPAKAPESTPAIPMPQSVTPPAPVAITPEPASVVPPAISIPVPQSDGVQPAAEPRKLAIASEPPASLPIGAPLPETAPPPSAT